MFYYYLLISSPRLLVYLLFLIKEKQICVLIIVSTQYTLWFFVSFKCHYYCCTRSVRFVIVDLMPA